MFVPVWVRRWAFKWEDLVYTFLQPEDNKKDNNNNNNNSKKAVNI